MACGGPSPRGGERHEPNPLFLAHAAGLSDIYVALETTLPDGFRLTRLEREANAREPFTTRLGREKRAIAPDAFIEIEDTRAATRRLARRCCNRWSMRSGSSAARRYTRLSLCPRFDQVFDSKARKDSCFAIMCSSSRGKNGTAAASSFA